MHSGPEVSNQVLFLIYFNTLTGSHSLLPTK